jgi:C4-dicarboxylate transporter, DcuC family
LALINNELLNRNGTFRVAAIMVFASSLLTGSGSASFFSFAPMASSIISGLGKEGISIILPIQMASSMGRAASPISGVIMAASEIANVSPFELAKRNLVPLTVVLIIMLVYCSLF